MASEVSGGLLEQRWASLTEWLLEESWGLGGTVLDPEIIRGFQVIHSQLEDL